MDSVLLAARLILAGVFLVSGVAKLLDQRGTRQAIAGFGLPVRLAVPIASMLPLAELSIVAALLVTNWAWWGSLAGLGLLLLFSAGIALNLARGRTPDCHCFGQLSSEPIGRSTLVRNALLAAAAGVVVGFGWDDPGPGVIDWMADSSTAERVGIASSVFGLVLIASLSWLGLQLIRQNGRILARLDHLEAILMPGVNDPSPDPALQVAGLPLGTPAPSFSLAGLFSETLTLDALRAKGKPVMLIFSDPHCGPCNALVPDIARWQRDIANHLTFAVISRGSVDANRAKLHDAGVTSVLLQHDREVAAAYASNGTPSAVVVQPDGTIGSPLAQGGDAIRDLVKRSTHMPPTIPLRAVGMPDGHRATHGNGNGNGHGAPIPPAEPRPAGLPIGKPAPALHLPDLDGRPVDLADYHGRNTLVLFWNPGCGYCRRMEDDLRAWEAIQPDEGPALLVVSTGTVEANRALQLRATVLLDEGFTAGTAFNVAGTPSAVLVDEEGNVAAPLAVGAPAILELARTERVFPGH